MKSILFHVVFRAGSAGRERRRKQNMSYVTPRERGPGRT
jgi:hypothetical protein